MQRLTTVALAILATLSAGRAEAQLGSRAQPALVSNDAALIAALQQQVAALGRAVDSLRAKAQYVYVDPGGNYTITSPGTVTIRTIGQYGADLRIVAQKGVDIRAGLDANLEGSRSTTVRSGATTTIRGGTVQINPSSNSAPVATVGSTVAPHPVGSSSQVMTGSNSVTIGN